MIDIDVEEFTAESAVDAGLIAAVQRGDCVINGSYKLCKDGFLKFTQNNFVFNDKVGGLRVGKFKTAHELMIFCQKYNESQDID